MMRSVFFAFTVSFAVHGFLAAVLIAFFKFEPQPDVLVTLDLSSVDMSFAEDEDLTAALMPLPPAPTPALSHPKELAPPSAAAKDVNKVQPLIPRPTISKSCEPIEKPSRMKTPLPLVTPPLSTVASRQARVDAPPKPRRTIKPDYPKGARQRGEQGDVILEIQVNESGIVDGVKVVRSCGYDELDVESVKAVQAAQFIPAQLANRAVASTARITLSFKLK